MKKIFIVGCPRSGTTLVQKLIGNHEDIYTCRETHYFQKIKPLRKRRKFLSRFFLTQANFMEAYQFIQSNTQLIGTYDSSWVRNFPDAVKFFDMLMTTEAILMGKNCWVEKTPGHIFHIDLISRYIEHAQYIHVLRDGRDVVASLVDTARKNPNVNSWKRYRNIEHTVDNYNEFIQKSLKYNGVTGHFFVSYEHILENAENVLKQLLQILGLSMSGNITLGIQNVHQNVVRGDEKWKNSSVDRIEDTRLVKFNKIFTNEEKELIVARLRPFPEFKEII